LSAHLDVPVVSTGALFRDQISRGTPLGREAESYTSQGQLVPDSVTNAMVEQRLGEADAAGGFILDGYPRNAAQVLVLEGILARLGVKLDAVVELALPESMIVERLLNRAQIEGRADDTEPVILQRIAVYREQTEPLSKLYRERGNLIEVDGVGSIDAVRERVMAALAAKGF